MFPQTLETDRLRLEAARPESVDLDACYQVCSADPGIDTVTNHVTWDPHQTKRETEVFLADCHDRWEAREGAEYVIRPRADEPGAGEIAGFCGMEIDWDTATATLGIWLRKRFWGRGYSGERAEALMRVAFDTLDLSIVAVSHHPENENSRRAIERYIERFGGRREGRLRNTLEFADGTVHDEVRYTIAQHEWREAVQ